MMSWLSPPQRHGKQQAAPVALSQPWFSSKRHDFDLTNACLLMLVQCLSSQWNLKNPYENTKYPSNCYTYKGQKSLGPRTNFSQQQIFSFKSPSRQSHGWAWTLRALAHGMMAGGYDFSNKLITFRRTKQISYNVSSPPSVFPLRKICPFTPTKKSSKNSNLKKKKTFTVLFLKKKTDSILNATTPRS